MPQMAPLNWFMLMTFFIKFTLYMMLSTILFFFYNNKSKNSKKTVNWKW